MFLHYILSEIKNAILKQTSWLLPYATLWLTVQRDLEAYGLDYLQVTVAQKMDFWNAPQALQPLKGFEFIDQSRPSLK